MPRIGTWNSLNSTLYFIIFNLSQILKSYSNNTINALKAFSCFSWKKTLSIYKNNGSQFIPVSSFRTKLYTVTNQLIINQPFITYKEQNRDLRIETARKPQEMYSSRLINSLQQKCTGVRTSRYQVHSDITSRFILGLWVKTNTNVVNDTVLPSHVKMGLQCGRNNIKPNVGICTFLYWRRIWMKTE